MQLELQAIREQQRESWNRFSPGWKKWDDVFMNFLRPMGDEIVTMINPKEKDVVLDVASGTGEPGLTIASKFNNGKVVLTDLSEEMLSIARENAMLRGLKNIHTIACDVCDLPFPENSFNAISCRFGFMFFPDIRMSAKEMARVLKPGGRIATSVWNIPDKNFWITAIMTAISKYMLVPQPAPGAPGMFRCSNRDLVADLFLDAGLKNTYIKEVSSKLRCKSVDIYWSLMTEVAASVAAALASADETTKELIKKEVFKTVTEKYGDNELKIDASALIIYAEK
jgi:ubiquinone/menaquinone biosynthesis C-methylase UbiE